MVLLLAPDLYRDSPCRTVIGGGCTVLWLVVSLLYCDWWWLYCTVIGGRQPGNRVHTRGYAEGTIVTMGSSGSMVIMSLLKKIVIMGWLPSNIIMGHLDSLLQLACYDPSSEYSPYNLSSQWAQLHPFNLRGTLNLGKTSGKKSLNFGHFPFPIFIFI